MIPSILPTYARAPLSFTKGEAKFLLALGLQLLASA